jgi:competence protein ComEA
MKNSQRDFLHFSRKELIGVLALLAITTVMMILPGYLPEGRHEYTEIDLEAEMDSLELDLDSGISGTRYPAKSMAYNAGRSPESGSKAEPVLFEFDPNTISEKEWAKLGVSPKTIATIEKYKAKGGIFRKPEDILRIYGLPEDLKSRFLPYVRIRQPAGTDSGRYKREPLDRKEPLGGKESLGRDFKSVSTVQSLDINHADSASWEKLPGIGGKLASRIIKFRDRLGGFYSIEQVGEVYGLQDSVFTKIRPMLLLGAAQLARININHVDENTLGHHPYIQKKIAHAIVQYRGQHGNFEKPEDLLNLALISGQHLEKLKPYLLFDDAETGK